MSSETLDGAILKQGDSYTLLVRLTEGEVPWVGNEIAPGTVVRFVAKPTLNTPDANAPIRKSSANSDQIRVLSSKIIEIDIAPADTRAIAFPGGEDTIPLFFELQAASTARVDTYRLESNRTMGKLYVQRDVVQASL